MATFLLRYEWLCNTSCLFVLMMLMVLITVSSTALLAQVRDCSFSAAAKGRDRVLQ